MSMKHRPERVARKRRSLRFEPLEQRTMMTSLPAGFTETELTLGAGLTRPQSLTIAPDGQFWVCEQPGTIQVVQPNGSLHQAAKLSVYDSAERGCLGIAFDIGNDGVGPNVDYAYVLYTAKLNDAAYQRISRFTIRNAGTPTPELDSERILHTFSEISDSLVHNSGTINVGPDGKLYITTGDNNSDRGDPREQVSQRLDSHFGKVLRMNTDGSAPVDNPFYTGADRTRDLIYALGLRNPFTATFDTESGRYFINDVGENAWEEINVGGAGKNYGWSGSSRPLVEGFMASVPAFVTQGSYQDPLFAFAHSDGDPYFGAITGGDFYNPAKNQFGSRFAGKYFFVEFVSERIFHCDPAQPGTSAASPGEFTQFATNLSGDRPIDIEVDDAGNLYYLTRVGNGKGAIYKISNSYPAVVEQPLDTSVSVGQTFELHVRVESASAVTYQWQTLRNGEWVNVADGGIVSGSRSRTLIIRNAAESHEGRYRVQVGNIRGSTFSSIAGVQVNPLGVAPSILVHPANAKGNEGESLLLTASASGSDPKQYQWQKLIAGSWRSLAGAVSPNHEIDSAVPDDSGKYRVIVSNASGTAVSREAAVVVNALPRIALKSPTASFRYGFGDLIDVELSALDAEDGEIPATAFKWWVDFGHEVHFHDHVPERSGVRSGSFKADFPESSPHVHYRIGVEVTDSNGAIARSYFDLLPFLVKLRIETNHPEASLTLDGEPPYGLVSDDAGHGDDHIANDRVVYAVAGSRHTLSAGFPEGKDSKGYRFLRWYHHDLPTHEITVPRRKEAVYRAVFAKRIEAESFVLGSGAKAIDDSLASGGKGVHSSLASSKTALATYGFMEPSGDYKIKAGYFDERDGTASASLSVRSSTIGWKFDYAAAGDAAFRSKDIGTLSITKGDPIRLSLQANAGEKAFVDHFEFIPTRFFPVSDTPGENDAPYLSAGAPAPFIENGVSSALFPNARIVDPDDTVWNGGKLIIAPHAQQSSDGSFASDLLTITPSAARSGSIDRIGSKVFYDGNEIGVLTGGTHGEPLIIALRQNIAWDVVGLLLRAVTFRAVGENPSTTERAFHVLTVDADGVERKIHESKLRVKAVNDAPSIVLSGSVTYTENDPALRLAPNGLVSDVDNSHFALGRLTVTIAENASPDDRLFLRSTGTGTGGVAAQGRDVLYSGVKVGTLEGGVGTLPLIIRFNSSASTTAVTQILRNVAFRIVSDRPTADVRTVTFSVSDGLGGIGNLATKTVQIAPVDDLPEIGGGTGTVGYRLNASAAVLVAPAAAFRDHDAVGFSGAVLTVRITDGASSENRMFFGAPMSAKGRSLVYENKTIGTYNERAGVGTTPLIITFNANASSKAIEKLIRSLRFRTLNGVSTAARTIEIQFHDSLGKSSNVTRKTIAVYPF